MRTLLLGLLAGVALAGCSTTVSGRGAVDGVGPTSGPSRTGLPAGRTTSGSNAVLSPQDLERAAIQAFASATAFRMKGELTLEGTELDFDLHYGKTSSDGSIIFGGYLVRVRYVHPDVYMRAGFGFWYQSAGPASSTKLGRAAIDRLENKWVRVPPGSALPLVTHFAVRSDFLMQLASLDETSTFSRGPANTINGEPAVSFVADVDDTVVYVPADGTPYPVRIEGDSTRPNTGTFDLSDWNVPFTAPPPPQREVVELSS